MEDFSDNNAPPAYDFPSNGTDMGPLRITPIVPPKPSLKEVLQSAVYNGPVASHNNSKPGNGIAGTFWMTSEQQTLLWDAIVDNYQKNRWRNTPPLNENWSNYAGDARKLAFDFDEGKINF
jgi:hypothetical protein